MPETIVAARGLSRVYGEGEASVIALDDVSIEFPVGGFTAVMGPSGSGKSTLMHLLAGLDRPTSGDVEIEGTKLATLSDDKLTHLRRDRVGFVFQAFNLLPVLTAEENILLPQTIAKRKPDQAWIDQLVAAVGIADRLSHRPSELSGGQQQRVALARALASRPAVIFADEPTGNLDTKTSIEILSLLRRSVDEFGQTIVMVTHDEAAAARADRKVILRDGKVVEDKTQKPTRD
jgi:putative ABC transport system ATP-binding protein